MFSPSFNIIRIDIWSITFFEDQCIFRARLSTLQLRKVWRRRLTLFYNFLFFGPVILLTLRWKNTFLCFFCAWKECLRRWRKFLSFFLKYYKNSDIFPQHGWYQQKFRCWNRQKLIFFKKSDFQNQL